MSLAPLVRVVDATLEATVVLSFSRVGHAVRSRVGAWQPVENFIGRGRTVVVTGANSGLGYATARMLLRAGATVHAVVRSDEKGAGTVQRLRREVGPAPDVRYEVADLEDLTSVRALAERLVAAGEPIHALVHNAGAMFPHRAETVDGLERTYQVHVVGPHLLTTLLLPRLRASTSARVVTVTSGGMYTQRLDVAQLASPDGYRPATAYAQAKRAQVVLTEQWQQRQGDGLTFHAVHPGWAATPGLTASLPRFERATARILRDADQGADSIAWLALADGAGDGGRLWHDRRVRATHRVPWTRTSSSEADALWETVSSDAASLSRAG